MKKKQKVSKKKMQNFFEKKGFYIALFSLLVIVGFSVYLQNIRSIGKNDVSFDDDAWQEAISESDVVISEETQKSDDAKVVENTSDDEKIEEKAGNAEISIEEKFEVVDAVEVYASTPTTAKAEPFSMSLPCDGDIIAECSLEELVYCKQMDDWRTHNGIDIAAVEGTSIKAAAEGVVSEVYEDDLLGIVVVLDHKNDVSSLYGNLQSLDFINVGTEVSKGDIIGGVGKLGALETGEIAHLHFEVHKNGAYENPSAYLE